MTLASDAELVPDMCAEKQRCWYSGYNIGDAMGFIILETYSKVWQADLQKKRDIYGARMVRAKDGPDDAAGLAAPKQDDTRLVFSTNCPKSIISKSLTPTMWLASWTWLAAGEQRRRLASRGGSLTTWGSA